jgi:two-component system, NtrC family, response regulator HydG
MSNKIKVTNEILGVSKHIKYLIEEIEKAVKVGSDVLILGPRGTGKELVAKEIHKRSVRKDSNFIAVDCGAIATDLFESEMFGHVKGAFTGAITYKKGKVAMAEGGTLFLDEIGNLKADHQGKLLRFLQEREYSPIGYEKDLINSNVIVIAATNKNDLMAPSRDSFRRDLYDRLNQYKIITTPLKHRYEDVVFYVNYFDKNTIDSPTKALLYSYDYPGNVRELRNLIGKDYDYVRREIRERVAQELEISNDMNLSPKESLFWKPYLSKLRNQKSDAMDSLEATFQLPK